MIYAIVLTSILVGYLVCHNRNKKIYELNNELVEENKELKDRHAFTYISLQLKEITNKELLKQNKQLKGGIIKCEK